MNEKAQIDIRPAKTVPRPHLLRLYEEVGWTFYTQDPERLEKALSNTDYLVTAWQEDILVGLARTLSDDVAIAYIQDILVLPSHQGQGIGRALVTNCLARYAHVRMKILLTDNRPDQIGFYQSLGFSNTRNLEEKPLNAFVQIEGVELK